jgi:hypothetical protein
MLFADAFDPTAVGSRTGPEVAAYTATVNDRIVAALRQAKSSLQPVRLGLGTGSADVSINRDVFTSQGWQMGFNPNGPSDKTVWVVKFEKPSGEPIAVLFNYAVHSTVTLGNQVVSGDLAGAAGKSAGEIALSGNGVSVRNGLLDCALRPDQPN